MINRVWNARLCASGALVGAVALAIAGSASNPNVDLPSDLDLAPYIAQKIEPVIPSWILVTNSPFDRIKREFRAQSDCLAEAMYHEARGEGLDGEMAVAEVVLRRTQVGTFPSTVCGVVHDGCQFSFACDGSRDRARERRAWAHDRQLADRIMSGALKLSNATGDATAFHSTDVQPAWSDVMIRTTQIGNHVFYKADPQPRTRVAQLKVDAPLRGAPEQVELRPSLSDPLPGIPASQKIQPQVQVPGAVGKGT